MNKTIGLNEWSGTFSGIDYELKSISISTDDETYTYWSVINVNRSTNKTFFVVAFSRDYTQFPHVARPSKELVQAL